MYEFCKELSLGFVSVFWMWELYCCDLHYADTVSFHDTLG